MKPACDMIPDILPQEKKRVAFFPELMYKTSRNS